MQTLTIKETARFLRERDQFVIFTHRRPDGDTVGSAVALCLGLQVLGKQAIIWENPQFTPRFAPYLDGLIGSSIPENATLVTVDTATEQLFPLNAGAFVGAIDLAIDHHSSNSHFACRELVLDQMAACGEILFALLQELEVPISPKMAEALYVAVSTDTGCFKYANTTSNTLRVAADLKELGADTFSVNKLFFDTKSLGRLRLEARLTQTMELFADGTVGLCLLPQAWLTEFGLTEDDVESISGFARSIEGIEIGIVIREAEAGSGKISLRCGSLYNAAALCGRIGGGGHAGAAGATVPGGLQAARNAILQVLADEGITS